ncbi:MAG: 16S rRNA (cytosine(1402)-N(4))-methyltransferase RsmH [Xanthomonadales bacterium]|nr:16S rRNA (cytosine(1402)-N(4))-methyltransferase RsmH [Xanthomonadales bacterium]MBK7144225.1 16S rRNA (cytosine(1402)-N(4))-methyltransferase RsmH [Xanthomonadales bacterium]MCC6561167.1 16S rRNA (cytosine(1402)-N(4))-methyltransferase RsmH [Xanthomonadales bacterium]
MGVHVPVLRDETLAALAIRPDGVYLDGTFGRGGHAGEILSRLGPDGRLLVMDKDPDAIRVAADWAARDARVAYRHDSFATLAEWDATAAGLDGVLLDLGVSSPQLDEPERGFSFMQDGPLDMRMDSSRGESAAEWIARAGEREIADVLFTYGEEKQSRRIAKFIVAARAEAPITRTAQLAAVVAKALGGGGWMAKHPATRTFQALRIAVNRELEDIEAGLEGAAQRLKAGGRLAVISFHSLEDRIVKRFMRGDAERVPVRRGLPPAPEAALRFRVIGKSVSAGEAEQSANPRSRSAVLRVAERVR